MTTSVVPRRYAQALLMIATEKDMLEQYGQELGKFKHCLQANQKVRDFLENPRVLLAEKKDALHLLIKDFASPVVQNFLQLILDKKREILFADIVAAYQQYADEMRNIVDVEVRSVVAMTSKDLLQLERKLVRSTGKRVRLHNVIDPALLGGIRIKIGDLVIDGSVTKRLVLLKKQLQSLPLREIEVKK